MAERKKKLEIIAHSEECRACLNCQLECSLAKVRVYNPSKARIKIEWVDEEPKISFTDECDNCGICVQTCMYGALTSNG